MNKPTVGIIGAGTMGAGIAQVAAAAGWQVQLMDADHTVATTAVNKITQRLQRLVDKGRLSPERCRAARDALHTTQRPADFANCAVVIEAVIENWDVKLQVFQALLPDLSADCLLATNTSSLSVDRIGQALGHAPRFAGMHFFNPAPLMPLVEVVSGPATAPTTADTLVNVAREWGKTVVRCSDTPGFIVNRVARGYYLEALRIFGEGVAGIVDIDDIMKRLGAFRMGPFELMDLVGIDVNYTVSCSVYEQLGKPPRLQPHPIQQDLYSRQCFGRKTGSGFYHYHDNADPTPAIEPQQSEFKPAPELLAAVRRFAARAAVDPTGTSDLEAYVLSRILVAIFNEAALALHEQVAEAADIDVAMKTGTNYPRGPLEWCAHVEYDACADLLNLLETPAPEGRYSPAPLFCA